MKKVSDEILIESYSKTGNVWKTAKEVGICGQSVYERLNKIGVIKKMNRWLASDDQILLNEYNKYKENNTLDELAAKLGRTKQFICRKAKLLGLTNIKDKPVAERVRKKLSEATKLWIKEKGHPKGYLGHKHGAETLQKLSSASRAAWENPNSRFNDDDFRQKLSDNLHNRKMNDEIYVFSNRGDYPTELGGQEVVFKSSWEVEVAQCLHKLVINHDILRWSYESKHFNFDDMKRTTRSYCPDFEVVKLNGDVLYIEVKGWKMKRSMERIKMFQERYPDVKLYVIDEKEYKKVISEREYLVNRLNQI